jgi:hypothetical protein
MRQPPGNSCHAEYAERGRLRKGELGIVTGGDQAADTSRPRALYFLSGFLDKGAHGNGRGSSDGLRAL